MYRMLVGSRSIPKSTPRVVHRHQPFETIRSKLDSRRSSGFPIQQHGIVEMIDTEASAIRRVPIDDDCQS